MPRFARRDDLSRRAWSVEYCDADPNAVLSETPVAFETELERDAVLGAGAAEVVLTQLVG